MRILVKDISDGSVLTAEIRDAYYSDTITYADENDNLDDVCVEHCITMEVNGNDVIYVILNSLEECNHIIQAIYKNGMYDFTNNAEYTFIYPERYSDGDLERLKTFEKKSTEDKKDLLQNALDRMAGIFTY